MQLNVNQHCVGDREGSPVQIAAGTPVIVCKLDEGKAYIHLPVGGGHVDPEHTVIPTAFLAGFH